MVLDLIVRNNWVPVFLAFSTQEAKAELQHTFRRRAKDANYRIVKNLILTAPKKSEIEKDVETHSKKRGFIIRPSAMQKAKDMWEAKNGTKKKPSRVVPLAESAEIERLDNQIERLTEELKTLSAESKEYSRKINKLDAQKRRLRTYKMRAAVNTPFFNDYKMLVTKRTEVQATFLNKQRKTKNLKRIRMRLKISKTGIYPKASNKPNTEISGKLVTLHDLAVECEKQARLGSIHSVLKIFRRVEDDLGKRKLLSNRWMQTEHVSTRGDTGYEYNVNDRGYVCSYISPAFGSDVGSVQHVTSDRWDDRKNQLAIELGFQASEKELVERVTESLVKLANS